MHKLSSQDRSLMIRFASSLPPGSPEKKAILASLQKEAFNVDTRLLPTPSGCIWVEWNYPGKPKEVVLTRGRDEFGPQLGKIVLRNSWQAYIKGSRSAISLGQKKPQHAAAEVVLELAGKGIVSTTGAEKELAEFEYFKTRPEIDLENFPTPAGCSWELIKKTLIALKQGSVILGKISKANGWLAWVSGDGATISLGAEEPQEAAKELVDELVARRVVVR